MEFLRHRVRIRYVLSSRARDIGCQMLAPATFELVRAIPIKEVIPVIERRVLIFVNFTRLAAYGVNGCLWRTGELSWDGLEIGEVGAKTVQGSGWDSPAGRRVPFCVDLDTGKAEGGSSPIRYGAGKSP